MEKEFYRKKLTQLRDLIELTEKMIKVGNDDLINILSFRTRLKGLVKDCDKKVENMIGK